MRSLGVVAVVLLVACRPASPGRVPPSATLPGYQPPAAAPVPVPPPPVGTGPAGSACLEGSACDSGVCAGLGCGPDAPGLCVARGAVCAEDEQAYCSCDGETFTASSSCPGRRYASRDACPPMPPG